MPNRWIAFSNRLRMPYSARPIIARGEEEPGPVVPAAGEADAQGGALVHEELVRDLDENAGAVAGIHLAAAGAAVVQVLQGGDPVFHQLVRLVALEVRDG